MRHGHSRPGIVFAAVAGASIGNAPPASPSLLPANGNGCHSLLPPRLVRLQFPHKSPHCSSRIPCLPPYQTECPLSYRLRRYARFHLSFHPFLFSPKVPQPIRFHKKETDKNKKGFRMPCKADLVSNISTKTPDFCVKGHLRLTTKSKQVGKTRHFISRSGIITETDVAESTLHT